MRFRVVGADRDTGSEVEIIVVAPNEVAAELIASRRNVLVSQVLPMAVPVFVTPAAEQCPLWARDDSTKSPYRRSPGSRWGYVASLIVLGGVAVFCCGPCSALWNSTDVATQMKPDVPLPAYDVVNRDTYDAPIKTQIELHAVVSGKLTELGLKQLLQKLYDEASATRGFKYHGGKPTHVFVYLYTSQDHFRSRMGQWIAMLSRIGADSRVEIQVHTELITQLNATPEFRYGLSESKRKEIFKAIIVAEDLADSEARRICPLPDPGIPGYVRDAAGEQIKQHVQTYNLLADKYKSELAQRYGLTQEQLKDISVEGVTKNWPM